MVTGFAADATQNLIASKILLDYRIGVDAIKIISTPISAGVERLKNKDSK
jgi:hypothetical protein